MIKYILIFVLSVCIASISQIILKKSATIERKNKINLDSNKKEQRDIDVMRKIFELKIIN